MYLDFAEGVTDSASAAVTITSQNLAANTPVTYTGDESKTPPGSLHSFTWLKSGADAGNVFGVPGKYAGTWLKLFNEEVATYTTAKSTYETDKGTYETYKSNVQAYESVAPWVKAWDYATNQNQYADPGIPAWPPRPPAYDGPAVGTGTNDLKHTSGFGKPSAGLISVAGGGRSFGAKGVGAETADASATFKESLYGVRIPAEDPNACTKSYSKVTLMPKEGQSFTTGNVKFKVGSVAWSTDYAFAADTVPAEATKIAALTQ